MDDNVLSEVEDYSDGFARTVHGTQPQTSSVTDHDEHPVFWGYFPAYDWVVFSWLFGGMTELPFRFPQLCLDVKQWALELGDPVVDRNQQHDR